METNTPKLMTVRQIAQTGVIPEGALRRLIKRYFPKAEVPADAHMPTPKNI